MDDGSEEITRGELFYIVSNIIKVLYQQEIEYIDSLKTDETLNAIMKDPALPSEGEL